MKSLNNPVTRIATILLTVMFLHSACGGGKGSPTATAGQGVEKGVFTGFVGNLNWEQFDEDAGPADGEGDGPGDGADGEGGFGVGGALGQFRNALVRVYFPSGEKLGEALTDNTNGMVTVKPGKTYSGSLLIEIHGQPNATYFEEGKNEYVPYPPGNVLRAIVADVRRNIGITPFTEAGYRLAVHCQSGQGSPEVCGSSLGTSNEMIPSIAAIQAGNGTVAQVLNQQLPAAMQTDEITRLPVIIGDTSGNGSAGLDARGRYGLANIAFSKQSAMYNTEQVAPTLLATEQLSQDLLDGKLDGMSNGAPAATAPLRTYDPHSLTTELTAALAQQAKLYGTDGALSSLPLISAFGNARFDGYNFDARLGVQGDAEAVAIDSETNSTDRQPGQITDYVQPAGDNRGFMVYGNMGNGGLLVKTDTRDSNSEVVAVGDNINGELGVGRTGAVDQPAKVSTAGVLTHAVGGFGHLVTRFADGSVYSVGDNSEGQLGGGMNGSALPRAIEPQKVPLPEPALAVASANAASFALLESGRVVSWGSAWGFGALGDGSANGQRVSPAAVMSTSGALADVVQIAARDNDAIVLKSDNTVWTWGSFSQTDTRPAPRGVSAGNSVATQVTGLPDGIVRKVLTEQGLFIVLMADGAVYSWGVHFDISSNDFEVNLQPNRVLNVPPLRDVMPGGFHGYGQRPFDRLTAMGVDYNGRYWKLRGQVSERYEPANPIAQRNPHAGSPVRDCASCHTVRGDTEAALPTTGPACVLPQFKLDANGSPLLVNASSDCASCHNGQALGNGTVIAALNCVKPNLPPAPARADPEPLTTACSLPASHPVTNEGLNNACSSCHNSVTAQVLTCSPALVAAGPSLYRNGWRLTKWEIRSAGRPIDVLYNYSPGKIDVSNSAGTQLRRYEIANDRIARVVNAPFDNNSTTRQFSYDTSGRITSVGSANEVFWYKWQYDQSGRLLAREQYFYNDLDATTRFNPNGPIASAQTTYVEASGRSEFEYKFSTDSSGRVVEAFRTKASDGVTVTVDKFEYDANGNMVVWQRQAPNSNGELTIVFDQKYFYEQSDAPESVNIGLMVNTLRPDSSGSTVWSSFF